MTNKYKLMVLRPNGKWDTDLEDVTQAEAAAFVKRCAYDANNITYKVVPYISPKEESDEQQQQHPVQPTKRDSGTTKSRQKRTPQPKSNKR